MPSSTWPLALNRRPRPCFVVAACLLAFVLSACTSWQVVGPTPAEYLRTQRPRNLRVTRADSSQVDLRTPVVHDDSLQGVVSGGLAASDTAHTVTVPLADVRSIAVRRFSLGKTLGLYVLITIPLAIAACSSGGGVVC